VRSSNTAQHGQYETCCLFVSCSAHEAVHGNNES
jgi:hypothetical protein